MSITSVAFYCVNRSTWDGLDVPELPNPMGQSPSSSSLDPYDAILPHDRASTSAAAASVAEHPCTSLKRLLAMGSFYYAADGSFDISTRLDRRLSGKQHDISQYDGRFVWNTFMINPLMDFRNGLESWERERLDPEGFFLLAIQGFTAVADMSAPTLSYTNVDGAGEPSRKLPTSLALISRLSWKRAGTRFNTRGVDDDGNVANFVETETLFNHEGVSVSYVQLRGSVPLFWEQQGLQTFSARIQLTRTRLASQPAFDRHFADLVSNYSRVHALNLLGTRDAETVLSNAYAEHIRSSMAVDQAVPPEGEPDEDDVGLEENERIGITNFDFHSVSRINGGLDGVRSQLKLLGPVRLKREAFACTIVDSACTVRRRQRGVFRVNCLDCLDRTSVVQAFLSEWVLEDFFERAGRHRETFMTFSGGAHPVWAEHRVLWADNGDALSKIYAGTGALNTTYTRTGNAKKTFGSFLSDAAKSAGRMYINNFQDKSKQNVIDALLGNMANQKTVEVYDPLHDAVAAELNAHLDEYSTQTEISVFAGTWNLNARPPGQSLLPWLMPGGESSTAEPDIYALGFQEIVPLSPQQILLTDPAKLRVWEGVIQETLSRRPNKKADYIILRSEQLVGTALVIFVKSTLLPHIRSVEATTRKTGLKGMSGNKGGVAIRLQYHDTTFCFVTAHFAAGHSNLEERNADYWTIQRGLTFQRGRSLSGHDHVIWLGDFNYRIDLPNDRARSLAQSDNYDALCAHDQLQRCHRPGNIFVGFQEGTLTFRPTYKYDVGTDVYDSSEKQRVPAWTDRILYSSLGDASSGHKLYQTSYSRAELQTSDHRPVYATFLAEVRIFDKEKRNTMRREILSAAKLRESRGRGVIAGGSPRLTAGTGRRGVDPASSSDEEITRFERELPDPSSDEPGHVNWFDEGEDDDDAARSVSSVSSATSSSEDDPSSSDEDNHMHRSQNPFRSKLLILRHANDDSSRNGSVSSIGHGSGDFTSSGGPRPSRSNGSLRNSAHPPTSYVPRRAPPPRPNKPSNIMIHHPPTTQDDLQLVSSTSRGGSDIDDPSTASSRDSGVSRPGMMGRRSTSYNNALANRTKERNLLED